MSSGINNAPFSAGVLFWYRLMQQRLNADAIPSIFSNANRTEQVKYVKVNFPREDRKRRSLTNIQLSTLRVLLCTFETSTVSKNELYLLISIFTLFWGYFEKMNTPPDSLPAGSSKFQQQLEVELQKNLRDLPNIALI